LRASDGRRCFAGILEARDNGIVIIPRASTQQGQFDSAVAEVERTLAPQVVRIRYTLGDDWSGEPAVFSRILPSDAASRHDRLWDVTDQVSTVIDQRIEPLEQWGVLPYFNFRSQSEQAQLNEPAWA
jgi:hypothetical protein